MSVHVDLQVSLHAPEVHHTTEAVNSGQAEYRRNAVFGELGLQKSSLVFLFFRMCHLQSSTQHII